MNASPAETSNLIRAAMTFYARGDGRIFNALSFRLLHGYSFRRIAREVGADRETIRTWCDGFASAGKDYCQLFGITPEEFARKETSTSPPTPTPAAQHQAAA